MPGVPPFEFQPEDFNNPASLQAFVQHYNLLVQELNRIAGVNGPVVNTSGFDLKGAPIINLGVPSNPLTVPNSAATHASASSAAGAAAQTALEATGTNILQTTRRINDQQQREMHSTFLNDVLNLPPTSNTSSISVVAGGGGTSTVTVSAGTFKWGDGSITSYAQRIDTFTNPGAGSNFYYYYLRKSDGTVQFVGPFTSDTSNNRLNANLDGRGFVGVAQVNAAGGGSGGAGGGGSGGCLEIGTPISVPDGKKWKMEIEPCWDWIVLVFPDGRRIVAARNTQFVVLKRVQDLDSHDLLVREDGKTESVERIEESHHPSCKMRMTVEGRLYVGGGFWLSNFKTL